MDTVSLIHRRSPVFGRHFHATHSWKEISSKVQKRFYPFRRLLINGLRMLQKGRGEISLRWWKDPLNKICIHYNRVGHHSKQGSCCHFDKSSAPYLNTVQIEFTWINLCFHKCVFSPILYVRLPPTASLWAWVTNTKSTQDIKYRASEDYGGGMFNTRRGASCRKCHTRH